MVASVELLSILSSFILSELLYDITDLLATILIPNGVTCLSMRNVSFLDTCLFTSNLPTFFKECNFIYFFLIGSVTAFYDHILGHF